MHRLADHVIDASREQIERIVQGFRFIHCDDGRGRTRFDFDRHFLPILEVSKEESLNRIDVRFRRCVDPLAEILGREACCGDALPAKPCRISMQYGFTFVDDDNHEGFPRIEPKLFPTTLRRNC
jgi:hypothetical protein